MSGKGLHVLCMQLEPNPDWETGGARPAKHS